MKKPQPRRYTIFRIVHEGKTKKYEIASSYDYPIKSARRIFQGRLLSGSIGGPQLFCLRPLTEEQLQQMKTERAKLILSAPQGMPS